MGDWLMLKMHLRVLQKGREWRDSLCMVGECPRQCPPELGTRGMSLGMLARRADDRKTAHPLC